MKSAAILALLSASASAFAPAATQQQSLVSLNAAERSKALPFMNRPALVSVMSVRCRNRRDVKRQRKKELCLENVRNN